MTGHEFAAVAKPFEWRHDGVSFYANHPWGYYRIAPDLKDRNRLLVWSTSNYDDLPPGLASLTCHRSFIQPRPERGGHLRLLARVEQSPGARNFHRVQRDGR